MLIDYVAKSYFYRSELEWTIIRFVLIVIPGNFVDWDSSKLGTVFTTNDNRILVGIHQCSIFY